MSKIKRLVYSVFELLLAILPIKKYIVFESMPTYADNTKYVFDRLLNDPFFSRYKLFWMDYSNTCDIKFKEKNVKVIKIVQNSLIGKIVIGFLKNYIISSAEVIICSNDFIPKFNRKKQLYVDLAHGEALKNCSNHYNLPSYYDSAMCLSPYLAKYDAINFKCDISKMKPLGYPRNDDLFGKKINLKSIFGEKFDKTIYWMPTYRQQANTGKSYSNIAFPIIYTEEIAKNINSVAQQKNILLIIKPHHAQDLSKIKSLNLSNIRFIDNKFLKNNKIENYELLRSVDALISDYSSVYYDYLLCDKPIGLCFDDFEEYSQREGFTVDPNYILAGGEKIYNQDDLCGFIERVSSDIDLLKDKRNQIKLVCHSYVDNNSTERVVEYIKNSIG